MHTLLLLGLTLLGADPWADSVVDWTAGTGGSPGYDEPAHALGEPTRITVDEELVTPFVPAWGIDEVVSLGAGGSLVLRFDEPVLDDPANPHGVDLLLFGNTGFTDMSYPTGVPGGLFGSDGGQVEVSVDGETWIEIQGCPVDGAWPTLGWQDASPYDEAPAMQPSDFTWPLSPGIQVDDIIGQNWDTLVNLYDGSGGGTGIDLADAGLASIYFVRISNAEDAFFSPEIDAVADVSPVESADVNLDRIVNVIDLLAVISRWGSFDAGREDIDRDGNVDISDLLHVIAQWGETP